MGTMNDGSPNMMLFTAPSGPTAADAIVSGSVVNTNGRAIKDVRVVLYRASDGQIRTAITNMFGYFRFDQVEVGEFYTMYVQSKRFTFENSPYSFTLEDDFTSMSFIAMPR
jgi:hypothetical protein